MEIDESIKKIIMLQTKEEVIEWLDKIGINECFYIINNDLTVDILHDLNLNDKNLTEIPVQFNKVNGYFSCKNNQLISLKGCPKIVNNSCKGNDLFKRIMYGYSSFGITSDFECDDYLKSSQEYKSYKLLNALKK